MDIERTIEFLLAEQAKHDARQTKIEEDILKLNSILLDVAASQERTNEIVAVLAEKLVDLTDLVQRHVATHS